MLRGENIYLLNRDEIIVNNIECFVVIYFVRFSQSLLSKLCGTSIIVLSTAIKY